MPQGERISQKDTEYNPSISKYKTEVANIILDCGCLKEFNSEKPFELDSKILDPIYLDNRLIISDVEKREKIVDYFIRQIKEVGIPDAIGGVASAGIPYAAFVALELNLPMDYAKPQPKDHGTQNQVEGKIEANQEIIVFEDSITTAGSSIRAINALRENGAIITDLFAIFTYGLKEAEENLKRAQIKLHALTNLETVVTFALKRGILKQDQVKIIKDWKQDPRRWGKVKS